jgi:hypothetical protein
MRFIGRVLFALALILYGAFYFASTDIATGRFDFHTGQIVLRYALPLGLLAFIPLPRKVENDSFDRSLGVVAGFVAGATALMFVWITFTLHGPQILFNVDQIAGDGPFVVSILGALLAGVLLTWFKKDGDNVDTTIIWAWALGIFIIHFIYCLQVGFLYLMSGPLV